MKARAKAAVESVNEQFAQLQKTMARLQQMEKDAEASKNVAYVTQVKSQVAELKTQMTQLRLDQARMEKDAAERETAALKHQHDDAIRLERQRVQEQERQKEEDKARNEKEQLEAKEKEDEQQALQKKLMDAERAALAKAANATDAAERAQKRAHRLAEEKAKLERETAAKIAEAKAESEKLVQDRVQAAKVAIEMEKQHALAIEKERSQRKERDLEETLRLERETSRKREDDMRLADIKRLEEERERAFQTTKLAQKVSVIAQQAAATAQSAAAAALSRPFSSEAPPAQDVAAVSAALRQTAQLTIRMQKSKAVIHALEQKLASAKSPDVVRRLRDKIAAQTGRLQQAKAELHEAKLAAKMANSAPSPAQVVAAVSALRQTAQLKVQMQKSKAAIDALKQKLDSAKSPDVVLRLQNKIAAQTGRFERAKAKLQDAKLAAKMANSAVVQLQGGSAALREPMERSQDLELRAQKALDDLHIAKAALELAQSSNVTNATSPAHLAVLRSEVEMAQNRSDSAALAASNAKLAKELIEHQIQLHQETAFSNEEKKREDLREAGENARLAKYSVSIKNQESQLASLQAALEQASKQLDRLREDEQVASAALASARAIGAADPAGLTKAVSAMQRAETASNRAKLDVDRLLNRVETAKTTLADMQHELLHARQEIKEDRAERQHAAEDTRAIRVVQMAAAHLRATAFALKLRSDLARRAAFGAARRLAMALSNALADSGDWNARHAASQAKAKKEAADLRASQASSEADQAQKLADEKAKLASSLALSQAEARVRRARVVCIGVRDHSVI